MYSLRDVLAWFAGAAVRELQDAPDLRFEFLAGLVQQGSKRIIVGFFLNSRAGERISRRSRR
jgi:hypothetical protein